MTARTGLLALAALSVAAAVAGTALAVLSGNGDPTDSLAASGLLFTLVGALVVLRQPGHRLGPLLLAIGTLGTVGGLAEAVTAARFGASPIAVPGGVWAGWFGDWYWVAVLWLQLVFLPLVFPDGRLPSPRWRWFARTAGLVVVLQAVTAMGSQQLLLDHVQLGDTTAGTKALWVDNPVGFLPVRNFEADLGSTLPLVALFVLGATWSLIIRYRLADDVGRRQVKVAVAGVALNAFGFVVVGMLDAALDLQGELLLLEFLLFLAIPVALGVAILRYRLYEIDRIVSRTVAWALVSAVLVGMYLGSVVALQSLLRPVMGEGDLPVALATLGAAAVARPLLRRVQVAVDRRFDRARYDAARTIDEFGRSLRDEVSRDAIVAALRDLTHRTFQPATTTVHLVAPRPEGARR